MKTAFIFDFGGVFMRTVDYEPRHAWDVRLGLPLGRVEQVVHGSASWRAAQTGQITVEAYWFDVGQQLGLNETDLAQLQVDFFRGDVLDTALVAFTRELKAHGHPVALLSNDSPTLLDKLHFLGIADLFDPLVISGVIGVMKPDAAAYEAVLRAWPDHSGEIVFVDDMPANIAGAEALGTKGILYRDLAGFRVTVQDLIE
jgi:HAD superfamily hydrolase (TIGR01509 family)